MLATGGSQKPPSQRNQAIQWIFATTMTNEELRASRVSRSLDSGSAKLVIVCRQEREKGTGVVIESLPLILESLSNATLDVVGDGGALKEFQSLTHRLGLNDRIRFHGKVSHDGVIDLLHQSDLFCYPTTASEGFPKVVLEALACGLPVVTTRVSVLPELIGAGGGVLLDETSPSSVAHAVNQILSDPGRYREMSLLALETAGAYSLECWRNTIGDQLRLAWGKLSGESWELLRAND
jgi:glycosyltransferase involved in cell wall biosynthesis